MSGWELYEKYEELMFDMRNVSIDTWESLSEDEQAVWNALAEAAT